MPITLLDLPLANRVASMPFLCIENEYPNKLSQVLADESDLKNPKSLHPAFYGCFDWHSAVHAHWCLITLLQKFPNLEHRAFIEKKVRSSLTQKKLELELDYFKKEHNRSFERPYGWAWFLKLQEIALDWDTEIANNLQPLSEHIEQSFVLYLNQLQYPLRSGMHSNTAFSLCLAYDYAIRTESKKLLQSIHAFARKHYAHRRDAPLYLEPDGYDFLSPSLCVSLLMSRLYNESDYKNWLNAYLPALANKDFKLEVGIVSDRTDGHMVHLDGLNYSRAYCLYGIVKKIPQYRHLIRIADEHINYSLPSLIDGNYEGMHWLGTFTTLALLAKEKL